MEDRERKRAREEDTDRDGEWPQLENLPHPVLEDILSKLDVPSIMSAASSCRVLKTCATQTLSSITSLHLIDVFPTPELLHRLLRNISVNKIKMDCTHLGDSAIHSIVKPSLEELHLRRCDKFSAKLLVEIGRKCQNLRVLSLELRWLDEGPENLAFDDSLNGLLQGCSQLQYLHLMVGKSIIDNNEIAINWRLVTPSLKKLDIGVVAMKEMKQLFNTPRLSNNTFSHSSLPNQRNLSFPHLQKLHLDLDIICDALVRNISRNLPLLSHLDLIDHPVKEPISSTDLTNRGFQEVCRCTKLQHLSLVRSQSYLPVSFKRVNDLGFLIMAENCFNLRSARFGGFCRITDAGIRAILHSCSNLQKLELLCTSQLTDLIFHDISATPLSLLCVTLQSCYRITDFSIIHLACCKSLQALDLRGCKEVSDASLKVVSLLPKLETLLLNGSNITDMGLSEIGRGKAPLVTLSLRDCFRISNSGIEALFAGHHLSKSLQNLDLSHIPNISDDAILHLVKSGTQIVELRVRQCFAVGDVSIMALASMCFEGRGFGSTLKLLDIFNCSSITKHGILWFKKPYFPKMRWLGLGRRIQGYVLDDLLKGRPLLQITQDGSELYRGQKDLFEDFSKYDSEEEDELEQWLRDYDSEEEDELEQWLRD